VRRLVAELDVPLIGFAGAPFTLASYLVEGGPSRTHARTKAFMYAEPRAWGELCDRLADIVIASLRAQVAAGAAAVQLFDSWAGALTPGQYARFVAPSSRRILAETAKLGVPRIHFGVTTGELLAPMRAVGADVLGVDWRVPLDVAARRVRAAEGPDRPLVLQGNLDPAVCLAPWPAVEAEVDGVFDAARAADLAGHVFNLGHGVLPETPPDVLTRIVEHVHARTSA
jgi:uroporphyrinogen decarboxylase